jgi:two-component system NtrC family response regulator
VLNLCVERAFRMHEPQAENKRLQAPAGVGRHRGTDHTRPADAARVPHHREGGEYECLGDAAGRERHGQGGAGLGLHQQSNRSNGSFVAINCAAIPENLLESELFGYEKGAFTGAAKTTPGKIETAHGGTLMLDEIGDMPMPLQAKLLRFCKSVWSSAWADARALPWMCAWSATHQNLAQCIKDGRFREDLYYRLAEIVVEIPPLRQRVGDAALLAHAFARRFAQEHGRSLTLADDALRAIEAHPWPGNIRELENRIKRATIMADGSQITAPMSASRMPTVDDDRSLDLRLIREAAEQRAVLAALARTDGTVAKAAELLGVSRPTLYDLMHRLGLKT